MAKAPRKRKPRVELQEMPEVHELCRRLVMQYHAERGIDEAFILVVGRPGNTLSTDTPVVELRLARAMEKFLLAKVKERADYVLEVVIDIWNGLGPKDQERRLDHALCFAAGKDEKGRWRLRKRPDVMEFTEVLERRGAYTPTLEKFVSVARQLPLSLQGSVA